MFWILRANKASFLVEWCCSLESHSKQLEWQNLLQVCRPLYGNWMARLTTSTYMWTIIWMARLTSLNPYNGWWRSIKTTTTNELLTPLRFYSNRIICNILTFTTQNALCPRISSKNHDTTIWYHGSSYGFLWISMYNFCNMQKHDKSRRWLVPHSSFLIIMFASDKELNTWVR